MKKMQRQNQSRKIYIVRQFYRRFLVTLFAVTGIVFTTGLISIIIFVLGTREQTIPFSRLTDTREELVLAEVIPPFPLGVDPSLKQIAENPDVVSFIRAYIAPHEVGIRSSSHWTTRVFGRLALMNWYQNLASISSRVLVIEPGERKEQVADNFGKILKWSESEKQEFLDHIEHAPPEIEDGKFYPGMYSVSRTARPADVAPLVLDRFNKEVLARYPEDINSVVELRDALTIASLLEREAYDLEDMRQISGVIWNRLFLNMRLQIDATLQYAKGSDENEPWWPRVVPGDKYITSSYNTYKNGGLPPAPIANVSLAGVLAALNPTKTDCLYYFHDKKAGFHCTKTYEEHVKLLKQYYGSGK